MHCFPQDVADNQIDSGDLMECLIQNKHQKDMNEKCAIGVTHFQLVSNTWQVLLALALWMATESLPLLEHQSTTSVKNHFLQIYVLFRFILSKCDVFIC